LSVLVENKEHISSSARLLNLSPRLLASMIYAEQSLNVRTGEETAETVLARMGYNTSVGIAQIKLTTAVWIEHQIWNAERGFLKKLRDKIPPSASRSELIERLSEPSWNTLYASAYVALIRDTWKDPLAAPWNISQQAGIIGTIYSLGILTHEGELRSVHDHPQINHFGKIAQEFFDSMLLREGFPE